MICKEAICELSEYAGSLWFKGHIHCRSRCQTCCYISCLTMNVKNKNKKKKPQTNKTINTQVTTDVNEQHLLGAI